MPKQTETPSKVPSDSWTILSLIQWTSAYFESNGIDSPRSTAEILLAHILEISRIELYLRYDQPMVSSELVRYKAFIRRRVRREPVAYIVGHKEFWSMPLIVNRQVLIPRPETECLVELALAEIPENRGAPLAWVLELGTGSGAIILALAKERPGHKYIALDQRLEAVMVSRQNADQNRLDTAVQFICGDWFSSLQASKAQFDLIVSNPPYIPSADIDGLQPEVAQYEPRSALDGGRDGLGCLKHIIETAPVYLRPGGVLVLEIGYDQAESVIQIANRRDAYDGISVEKDFSGLSRVVRMATKKL
jgi:release factor glutamine methyltransferase